MFLVDTGEAENVMSDNTLQMAMLYDFFGDLLTEKQREYFDLYHNEDLSLAEIAEKADISKQGVFDIIKRAESKLLEIENKTGIIAKWLEARESVANAKSVKKGDDMFVTLNNYFRLN